MATIWKKNTGATCYEIRKAGNTTRLYTDGVFHSQYNPNRPVTGSVWDMLMLPAFFPGIENIRRVLVLGVGGGSVIQLLHRHVKPDEIVGVELNPVHIHVARKFFGVNNKIARLYKADAIQWIEDYQGPPFDMIIDDLFGEIDGEGVRPVPLNARWLNLLNRHVTKNGLIVANVVDKKSLTECAYFTNRRVNNHFKSAFRLTIPQLENHVAAFLKYPSSSKQLKNNIKSVSGLSFTSGNNKLKIRITNITK